VADVGAGNGDIAREAATRVGGTGSVYATEVDSRKLARLRKMAKRYPNIRVVGGTEVDAGLPEACCDSIVLRGVYHHLTKPLQLDASLHRALKPGGRVAVIDFAPKKLLTWFFPVHGVPTNRHGHGVSREVVVQELKQARFEIEAELPDWPGGQYCVVARRPSP
jgi:ubiquinone/menaquinone biosynthesis C-methylase UbiE